MRPQRLPAVCDPEPRVIADLALQESPDMAKFPNTMSYTGANTPVRLECDVQDLDVEGEIPASLDGAFYRVQPDPPLPPRLGDDIMFNGDGMVSMFRVRNGRVDLKQRWCRTDKWKLEHEAGHALF